MNSKKKKVKFAYVEKKQYLCKLFAQICAYTRRQGENGKLKGENRKLKSEN